MGVIVANYRQRFSVCPQAPKRGNESLPDGASVTGPPGSRGLERELGDGVQVKVQQHSLLRTWPRGQPQLHTLELAHTKADTAARG